MSRLRTTGRGGYGDGCCLHIRHAPHALAVVVADGGACWSVPAPPLPLRTLFWLIAGVEKRSGVWRGVGDVFKGQKEGTRRTSAGLCGHGIMQNEVLLNARKDVPWRVARGVIVHVGYERLYLTRGEDAVIFRVKWYRYHMRYPRGGGIP